MFEDWRLDVARRELRSADNTFMFLSGAEFDLLLAFAEHPQRVLTRDQLLDLARGVSHAAFDRSIDVLVSRLRRKLELDAKNPSLIRTVRNGGYIFTPTVRRALRSGSGCRIRSDDVLPSQPLLLWLWRLP